jgi:acyl-CoA thioesterase
MLNSHRIVHGGMIFALGDTAFAYVCNGANQASVAAQASVVFLSKVAEGETLVAEATEVAKEGRAGVTRVAIRTASGRAVAEFTGYSRTIGGTVVEI